MISTYIHVDTRLMHCNVDKRLIGFLYTLLYVFGSISIRQDPPNIRPIRIDIINFNWVYIFVIPSSYFRGRGLHNGENAGPKLFA